MHKYVDTQQVVPPHKLVQLATVVSHNMGTSHLDLDVHNVSDEEYDHDLYF